MDEATFNQLMGDENVSDMELAYVAGVAGEAHDGLIQMVSCLLAEARELSEHDPLRQARRDQAKRLYRHVQELRAALHDLDDEDDDEDDQ